MSLRSKPRTEAQLLRMGIARLRASVMAVTFGLVGGAGLFILTAWLLVQGGDPVGPHLSLLSNFLPGYSVSWPGAFIGFAHGTVAGALAGWSTAWIYNWIAASRMPEQGKDEVHAGGDGASVP